MPFQFRFMHETNQLIKAFTYKDKQNHLRRSSVVYKLTCTCGSNYIGQTRRNLITRINEHKFDQRSEICKHLLANPTHRFNFKQPEILGNIVCQKKLHLLESLLIQEHQPDLNIDGSSIPILPFNTKWSLWRNRERMPSNRIFLQKMLLFLLLMLLRSICHQVSNQAWDQVDLLAIITII